VNAGSARCRGCRAPALSAAAANRYESRSAVLESSLLPLPNSSRAVAIAVRRYGGQTGADGIRQPWSDAVSFAAQNSLTWADLLELAPCAPARLVRDEEAAGSHPATPTQVRRHSRSWQVVFSPLYSSKVQSQRQIRKRRHPAAARSYPGTPQNRTVRVHSPVDKDPRTRPRKCPLPPTGPSQPRGHPVRGCGLGCSSPPRGAWRQSRRQPDFAFFALRASPRTANPLSAVPATGRAPHDKRSCRMLVGGNMAGPLPSS